MALLGLLPQPRPLHHSGGDISFGPGGDLLVVIKARHRYLVQGLCSRDCHGQDEKFLPGKGLVGVEVGHACHLTAYIDAFLGQAQGGIMAGTAVQIGIGHAAGGHSDGNLHGGWLGDVAHAVNGHIGEHVGPLFVLVGGVPEGGGVRFVQGHLAPGGAVHHLVSDEVSLRVHSGEGAGDGNVLIGGQGEIFCHGRGVLPARADGGDHGGGHRHGQGSRQQQAE